MNDYIEEVEDLKRLLTEDLVLAKSVRLLQTALDLKETPEEGGYESPGFHSKTNSWTFLEIRNAGDMRLYHPDVKKYEEEIKANPDELALTLKDHELDSSIGEGLLSLAAGDLLAGELEALLEPLVDWDIELITRNQNHRQPSWESLDSFRFTRSLSN